MNELPGETRQMFIALYIIIALQTTLWVCSRLNCEKVHKYFNEMRSYVQYGSVIFVIFSAFRCMLFALCVYQSYKTFPQPWNKEP